MRTIKFRAWDSELKEMLPVYDLKSKWMNSIMQFTGLLDKNGKEIWEGDIVKRGKLIKKVEWVDNRCGFNLNNVKKGGSWFKGEIEVIGNIYSNPELIN